MTDQESRPPFTRETALQKVRAAEDGWNNRNPQKVALAYSPNSQWRNRNVFINGNKGAGPMITPV